MTTPRFSVITPVHDPPIPVLEAMLASVADQTYESWEHCLVDDGSTDPQVWATLQRAAAHDRRVHIARREQAGGIVAASNDALDLAQGEFVAFCDHDDLLHRDALARVSRAIDEAPDVDYLYTDEDKVDDDGTHHTLFLKPDWTPERMRVQMYTCHLSVARRALVEEVGRLRPGFDGSQDWDLVLRLTERARRIVHVRDVCYHWRTVAGSAAADIDAKPWAIDAARRAIADHLARVGLEGTVADTPYGGVFRIRPALRSHPLVSIVIPTAGSSKIVRGALEPLVVRCVRSIVERSTYENYELVIVADAPTPAPVRAALTEIAGERVRFVEFNAPFNFSQKINLGALHARGDLLLLLNDDIEVLPDGWRDQWPALDGRSEWLESMVMYAKQPDVGAVGARLYFGDLRIQHAGVVMHDGLPSHQYRGFPSTYPGYFANAVTAHDFLALTAACLMVPRRAFEDVGGLSLQFPVNFNDVDFCLKLHVAGYRCVYDADVELLHYESATREAHVNAWEIDALRWRWAKVMADDPYFHPRFYQQRPHFQPPPMLSDGTLLDYERD
jgi:glycosyltransferase involved in cell wall biosynthesis